MPKVETFEYSVIRYVPRVEREEFINIGVIVFSKHKKFLDVKYHLAEEKLRAIDQDCDLNLLRSYLRSWQLISSGDSEGGLIASQELPYRFRWLTASRSTVIQASRPHPGRTDNPAKILAELFEKYVS